MRIIRFLQDQKAVLAAVSDDEKVFVLPHNDLLELVKVADDKGVTPLEVVQVMIADQLPIATSLGELELLVPIEAPEVWAAGVTYEKSKEARNYEATGGKLDATTFYDKVYDAKRPEIFFKSTLARTKGPDQEVYIRTDSNWQIPEPELGLIINHKGKVIGYTAGNDMSSRDIEGENPLYLPQAKIWKHSCSIGPAVRLAETVIDPYSFEITCRIYRDNEQVFEGKASTGQLKRKFDELVSYLVKDNEIFDGTVLLTGTCIVPPNEFTLADGDLIEIEISDIGILKNPVKSQVNKAISTSK
ncbi:fumarylacetoacetate hydrolase family protein [Halalkalibacter akibai]|uniref:Fumarylacetoacetate hydrolase family protein n=1 Tax=Halalkalibacter akibai (strain ATCC 43226 / DSM 21942 / CIP 109018 / JCM 9157 / 1139) TaxID=1236973 RepID=W4QWS0_HALA3|nr:fumarylacetoacetate hydrolase family protein [Halalkalibacter akibai]GAE36352.1 fumarylacetoacetate hydrolase family protein [Halalkalibacter akibai JCM 9157]